MTYIFQSNHVSTAANVAAEGQYRLQALARVRKKDLCRAAGALVGAMFKLTAGDEQWPWLCQWQAKGFELNSMICRAEC